MNQTECNNIFKDTEIIGENLVIKSNIIKIIDFIKTNYHFGILKNITAVDLEENGVELIYHLFNVVDEENLLISIMVKDEAQSVSKLFDSAIADEKEIYDLFGIKFIGNEELKRLYMRETWEGHPLKKDYVENDERLNWNDKA